MDRSDKQRIEGIVQRILDDFGDDRAINKTDLCNEPDKTAIIDVIDKLMKILYPGYYSDKLYKIYSLKNSRQIKQVLQKIYLIGKNGSIKDGKEKKRDYYYEYMCAVSRSGCSFPYFYPYEIITREIREFF